MRNYIPSLNGLRALSIFSVLLVHINIQEFHNAYRIPLLLDRELGVNIFFILSGFLITTLLLQEEKLMGVDFAERFLPAESLPHLPRLLCAAAGLSSASAGRSAAL